MDRARSLWVAPALVMAMLACMATATAAAADPLGDAVDNTRLSFATSGSADWAPTTSDSVSGGDSAQSGVVSFGERSALQTTVTGPGRLSFWWKTAADSGDTLTLWIDGSPAFQMPSPVSWNYVSGIDVGSGVHGVTWEFLDGSILGSGRGRVDAVEFNSAPTLAWTGAAGYTSDGVEPGAGAPAATFVYRVKYTDVDGGAPLGGASSVYIRDAGANITGSPFLMSLVSGDPATGAVYGFSTSGLLLDHAYTYQFAAVDAGGLPAAGPPAGVTGGPVVEDPPTLTWTGETGYGADGVSPDRVAPAASYVYRITYTNTDGDAPAAGYPKVTVYKGDGDVFLPGSPFTMSYVSGSYATGAIYTLSRGGLAAHGDYAYRFDVQDIHGLAAGIPSGSTMSRGPIVNTAPTLAWEGGVGYTADAVEPNVGDPTTTFAFRVAFVDADGDAPNVVETGGEDVWLHVRKGTGEIAGSPFQMVYSHRDGTTMYYTCSQSGLAVGSDYSYRIEATDRPRASEGEVGEAATGPPTGWTGGPTVDPVNHAPLLDWTGEPGYLTGACAPLAGTPAATYVYRVKYADQDGDAPAGGSVKVHIEKGGAEIAGSPFTMTWVSGTSLTGSIYRYTRPGLAEGSDYTYAIEAQDEHAVAAVGDPVASQVGPIADGTAPITTASGLQATTTSGWRNTDQSVTLSPGDGAGSGVASTTYQIDGGSSTPYGGAFLVSGAGNRVVTYHSTDLVGNVEGARTGYVNIDVIAPVTTATGLQADATSGWRNTGQTVELSAGDAGGSGVKGINYQIDDDEKTRYRDPFEVSGAGSHTITYYSNDGAGNAEPTQTGYVNIDVTAPTTVATGLADKPDNGWVMGSTTLALAPADAGGAGVALVEYRIDSGVWTPYTVPVQLSAAEGSHAVDYRSTDAAGNEETYQTGFLNVDASAPSTTAQGLQPDATSGWRTTSQSVTLEAVDKGGSGAVVIRFAVDGGGFKIYKGAFSISTSGSHVVAYYSTDAAGNKEVTQTGYVNIDTAPPVTTEDVDDAAWHRGAVTVQLTPTDSGSGMGGGLARIEHSTDAGETWQQGTEVTFTIWRRGSGSGVHVLLYRSVDAVGNAEETQTCEVRIDARPPTITTDSDGLWHAISVTLHLTATDGLSGVARLVYSIDGDAEQTVVGSTAEPLLRITRRGGYSGVHWVTYRAYDAVGNVSNTATCAVKLDGRDPLTTDDAPTGTQTGATTVHLSATDAHSGVAGTWYELDGAAWTPYDTAGIEVPAADGVHRIRYYSTDKAGRTEPVRSCSVTVDVP